MWVLNKLFQLFSRGNDQKHGWTKRPHLYHRCPECGEVALNAEWHCVGPAGDITYTCPFCYESVGVDVYNEQRLDRLNE